MTGAEEARVRLLADALRQRGALAPAINAVSAADRVLRAAADLNDALPRCAALVLAVDALADAAATLARDAREALAAAMWETGATGFRLPHHTVSVAAPRRSVVITGAVPPEFMRQPPPAPDKTLLARALAAGEVVPGAAFDNGGGPVLSFRPIKEIAA